MLKLWPRRPQLSSSQYSTLKYEYNTIDPRFVHFFFFEVDEWVDWFENFGDGRGYLHTQALGIYIVHAYAIIANTVL